jgi:hypothetical protein
MPLFAVLLTHTFYLRMGRKSGKKLYSLQPAHPELLLKLYKNLYAFGNQGALFEKTAPWTPAEAFHKKDKLKASPNVLNNIPLFNSCQFQKW